ncbi:MAG: glycosyltransferase [Cyanobacteria bacterium J06623_4]
MTDSPRISVLINNYNYASFLTDAIDSALQQPYQDVEVVVVDDGSSDNSDEVIAGYGDRIIPVIKQNGGQASAFNAGFAVSTGDIICFLDADDYFSGNKLTRVLEMWRTHPDAGWLFHTLEEVDEVGCGMGAIAPLPSGYVDYRQTMFYGQNLPAFPATTGLCFHRNVLARVLPMPEEIRISADQFLRLSAVFLSPGVLLSEAVAVHRIHGKNLFAAREDTALLSADTNLKAAYHLRSRFPKMKRFADGMFAHALGQLLARKGVGDALSLPEAQAYIRTYWTVDVWVSGVARTLYNFFKTAFQARYFKLFDLDTARHTPA